MTDGPASLHVAARNGDAGTVTALLHAGADPRATDSDGSTPLHWAAQYGHVESVAALLDAGADPRATGGDGWTPLHVAARDGHAMGRGIFRPGCGSRAKTEPASARVPA